MPRCFVKQPDGKYAIWSSVVDNFVCVNCSIDEAIAEEIANKPNYPGNLKADLFQEFANIELHGRAWKWTPTFDEALQTILELHGQAELDRMKLMLSGECQHDWGSKSDIAPHGDGLRWDACRLCGEIKNLD